MGRTRRGQAVRHTGTAVRPPRCARHARPAYCGSSQAMPLACSLGRADLVGFDSDRFLLQEPIRSGLGADSEPILHAAAILYRFSPAAGTWTAPAWTSSRCSMGFAATPDGSLWIFGGNNDGGDYGGRGGWGIGPARSATFHGSDSPRLDFR